MRPKIRIETINFCEVILSNVVLLYFVSIDRYPIFSVTAAYQHASHCNCLQHFLIHRR